MVLNPVNFQDVINEIILSVGETSRLYFHTCLMRVTLWATAQTNRERERDLLSQETVICNLSVSGHLLDSGRKVRQIHLDRK